MKLAIISAVLILASQAHAFSFSKVVCATGSSLVTASTNLNASVSIETQRQQNNCSINSKSINGLMSHVIKSVADSAQTVEACAALNLDLTCG